MIVSSISVTLSSTPVRVAVAVVSPAAISRLVELTKVTVTGVLLILLSVAVSVAVPPFSAIFALLLDKVTVGLSAVKFQVVASFIPAKLFPELSFIAVVAIWI
ncbi:hypothetical protein ADUPG1_011737 [Aduncisulcus paluster]|uniref:Uncharacterized protein n=1 Tax=Aduncisulcus paluster TaxID=2918883 RepID=A0ABQ5JWY2_9EUKA|nr:hypothetical protein ADUPG1_011737 [Aduncisulcus paluster]